MLLVTIFTVMMNNCRQVVEFANGFKKGGGGGAEKNSSTKIPRVVCLSHLCTFRHFCGKGRQIRPAELGKQPEF